MGGFCRVNFQRLVLMTKDHTVANLTFISAPPEDRLLANTYGIKFAIVHRVHIKLLNK